MEPLVVSCVDRLVCHHVGGDRELSVLRGFTLYLRGTLLSAVGACFGVLAPPLLCAHVEHHGVALFHRLEQSQGVFLEREALFRRL